MPVKRILFRAGILPPPPMVVFTQKGGAPQRPRDPLTGKSLPLPPASEGGEGEGEGDDVDVGDDNDVHDISSSH